MTKQEKEIWNRAVVAICKELFKYDGVIPEKFDREYMFGRIDNFGLYCYLNFDALPALSIIEVIKIYDEIGITLYNSNRVENPPKKITFDEWYELKLSNNNK